MFLFLQKKFLVKKFAVAVLISGFLTAALASCGKLGYDDTNYPGELPEQLIGIWDSDYSEVYDITAGNFNYDGGGFGDFAGTIEFVSNYSANSGVIIIKYTSPPPTTEWYTYIPDYDYFGVYYRNLTAATVDLSNSYDPDGVTETATKEAAMAKFTKSGMAIYATMRAPCIKR